MPKYTVKGRIFIDNYGRVHERGDEIEVPEAVAAYYERDLEPWKHPGVERTEEREAQQAPAEEQKPEEDAPAEQVKAGGEVEVEANVEAETPKKKRGRPKKKNG